jgi:hypothetical protein
MPKANLIDAIVQGADGIELDRVSQTVKVLSASSGETAVESDTEETGFPSSIIIGGGILLLVIGAAVIVSMTSSRKRQQKLRDDEWNRQVGGIGAEFPTVEDSRNFSESTVDSWEIPPDAFGRLQVIASDDATMINQHFDITGSRTTLGRKADNDIIFPKDTPVSRHHALIEEKNGGLFLTELMDPESFKRPTYGTFVNEREVGSQSILLQNGDEIRLGKRVTLKFEAGKSSAGDGITMDGFSDDRTDTQTL